MPLNQHLLLEKFKTQLKTEPVADGRSLFTNNKSIGMDSGYYLMSHNDTLRQVILTDCSFDILPDGWLGQIAQHLSLQQVDLDNHVQNKVVVKNILSSKQRLLTLYNQINQLLGRFETGLLEKSKDNFYDALDELIRRVQEIYRGSKYTLPSYEGWYSYSAEKISTLKERIYRMDSFFESKVAVIYYNFRLIKVLSHRLKNSKNKISHVIFSNLPNTENSHCDRDELRLSLIDLFSQIEHLELCNQLVDGSFLTALAEAISHSNSNIKLQKITIATDYQTGISDEPEISQRLSTLLIELAKRNIELHYSKLTLTPQKLSTSTILDDKVEAEESTLARTFRSRSDWQQVEFKVFTPGGLTRLTKMTEVLKSLQGNSAPIELIVVARETRPFFTQEVVKWKEIEGPIESLTIDAEPALMNNLIDMIRFLPVLKRVNLVRYYRDQNENASRVEKHNSQDHDSNCVAMGEILAACKSRNLTEIMVDFRNVVAAKVLQSNSDINVTELTLRHVDDDEEVNRVLLEYIKNNQSVKKINIQINPQFKIGKYINPFLKALADCIKNYNTNITAINVESLDEKDWSKPEFDQIQLNFSKLAYRNKNIDRLRSQKINLELTLRELSLQFDAGLLELDLLSIVKKYLSVIQEAKDLKECFFPDLQQLFELLDSTFDRLIDCCIDDINKEKSIIIADKFNTLKILAAANSFGIQTRYKPEDLIEAEVCALAQGSSEEYASALSKVEGCSNKKYLLSRVRKLRLMHLFQLFDRDPVSENYFLEAKDLAEQITYAEADKPDMQGWIWLGNVHSLWIDGLLRQNNVERWDAAIVKAEEVYNRRINGHQELLQYTLRTVVYKLVELQAQQTDFDINWFKKTLDVAEKSESVELFEYVCHISMQMVHKSPALLQSVCSMFADKAKKILSDKSKRRDINYCRMFYNLALLIARFNIQGFEKFKSDTTEALLVRLMVEKNFVQAIDTALMAEKYGIPGKLNFIYNQQINLTLQEMSEPDAVLSKALEDIELIQQKQPEFDISKFLEACTKYVSLHGSESFQEKTIAKISELGSISKGFRKPLVEAQAQPNQVTSAQLDQIQSLPERQSNSHLTYYLLAETLQAQVSPLVAGVLYPNVRRNLSQPDNLVCAKPNLYPIAPVTSSPVDKARTTAFFVAQSNTHVGDGLEEGSISAVASQLSKTSSLDNRASSITSTQQERDVTEKVETNMTSEELERVMDQLPDVPTASKTLMPA